MASGQFRVCLNRADVSLSFMFGATNLNSGIGNQLSQDIEVSLSLSGMDVKQKFVPYINYSLGVLLLKHCHFFFENPVESTWNRKVSLATRASIFLLLLLLLRMFKLVWRCGMFTLYLCVRVSVLRRDVHLFYWVNAIQCVVETLYLTCCMMVHVTKRKQTKMASIVRTVERAPLDQHYCCCCGMIQ